MCVCGTYTCYSQDAYIYTPCTYNIHIHMWIHSINMLHTIDIHIHILMLHCIHVICTTHTHVSYQYTYTRYSL